MRKPTSTVLILLAGLALLGVAGCGNAGSHNLRSGAGAPAQDTPATSGTSSPGWARYPSADPTGVAPRPSPTARPTRTPAPEPQASTGYVSASPATTVEPAPTSSPKPKPRPTGPLVITQDDSWLWSQPELEGSSVELAQRQFVQDPGYAEWEIRPVAEGTTVIRSTGSLTCHQAEPPCMAPNRGFEVRIVVS